MRVHAPAWHRSLVQERPSFLQVAPLAAELKPERSPLLEALRSEKKEWPVPSHHEILDIADVLEGQP